MKPSSYNYSFTLTDGITLFINFYTLALIALNPSESKIASEILAGPNLTSKKRHFMNLKKLLKDHGFIVDDGVNEIELLKTQHIKSKEDPGHLSLTIVPTLFCNFSCTYCYQDKKNERMSREVENAIIRYVRSKVAKNGGLSITWFGGEPLLCIKIIERLSNAFIEICQNQGAKYSSNIITNGYFLDSDIADRLLKLQITSAQVTIDGPPEIHDPRRPLTGGGKTFETILNNIKEVSGKIRINIRMNVDGRNRDRIIDLLNIIENEGLKNRVSFYLGQTYPYTEVCQDVSGSCLKDDDFSLLELETAAMMVEHGYASGNIPKAKNYYCMADCKNAYAITPSGGMVKCWNDVADPEAVVMHLTKPVFKNMKMNAEKHLKRNPFDLKCMKCLVLPICMGGCPYIFEKTGHLHCHEWKQHLNENLFFYYYLKKAEQETEIAKHFWNLADSFRKVNTNHEKVNPGGKEVK